MVRKANSKVFFFSFTTMEKKGEEKENTGQRDMSFNHCHDQCGISDVSTYGQNEDGK